MTSRLFQVLTVALFAFIPSASPSSESEIQPLFDLGAMSTTPFPSDRFTVPDDSHLTGRRVQLPRPDCDLRPSDCNDIDTINTLDGFNLQPRLSIPFSGPIDPATVTSDTVFLLSLGDTVDGTIRTQDWHQPGGVGRRDEHPSCGVGRAPRSAHPLRAHRHPRRA